MRSLRAILMLACSMAVVQGESWSLEQALQFARTNAPDSRIARHRINAAQAVLSQADAAYWPKVRIASSYTRTDNPAAVFGMALNQRAYSPSLDFNNVPDADNLNAGAVVNVPIYAGGRNSAARRAARAGTAAARAEADAVRNLLEFEVARAYHTILKTRRFVEAAQSAARAFEMNQALAQKRLDAGTILRTELLDIEVRLAQAREELVRAENANRLARLALQNLLGLEAGAVDVSECNPSEAAPEIHRPNPRPELTAIVAEQEAAEANVRRNQAGYLPRIDAFGRVDHDSGWKFNRSGKSYTVGVVAQWDLWDGHLTRSRVSEARAELEQLREEERKLRLAIQLEMEQAQLQVREAAERLAVTERTVRQAEESVEITRARFEQGLALSTQLIDAETALTSARMRRAEAEADRRIAAAALRKASGISQLEGY